MKIAIKYLYKKRLKSLLDIFFLATYMYNILKKLALSKLALIERKRYYIYQIYQITEARLKKLSLLLPALLLSENQKTLPVLKPIAGKTSTKV